MRKAEIIAKLDRPLGSVFVPVKATKAKPTLRHIGYSCSAEKYTELQAIAKKHEVTLKQLLKQMVDFAVANMAEGQ